MRSRYKDIDLVLKYLNNSYINKNTQDNTEEKIEKNFKDLKFSEIYF